MWYLAYNVLERYHYLHHHHIILFSVTVIMSQQLSEWRGCREIVCRMLCDVTLGLWGCRWRMIRSGS